MLTFINYFTSSQQYNELTLKAENDAAVFHKLQQWV